MKRYIFAMVFIVGFFSKAADSLDQQIEERALLLIDLFKTRKEISCLQKWEELTFLEAHEAGLCAILFPDEKNPGAQKTQNESVQMLRELFNIQSQTEALQNQQMSNHPNRDDFTRRSRRDVVRYQPYLPVLTQRRANAMENPNPVRSFGDALRTREARAV